MGQTYRLIRLPRMSPTTLTHPPGLRLLTPLAYQSTTSLGLAQLHLCSPKAVMETGAAARALKNGITFFAEVKSSWPIKYEYIHPLSHYLRIQSLKSGIKFGIGQVHVRISTYERSGLLQ